MRQLLALLLAHRYAFVFGAVLAEQLGLPIPCVPVLLAAGALAATGRLSIGMAIAVGAAGCLAGDIPWYWLGRIKGAKVLKLLCKVSLEPDSCVRKTEEVFAKRGAATLLYAKYIPGLSTVAPPLAGVIRMHFGRFLFFDIAGSLIWAASYLMTGWLFGGELERLADRVMGTGKWLGVAVCVPLLSWLIWKYWQRWSFLRKLRISRIAAEEVKAMMDRGEPLVIIDLRHELEEGNEILPGALHYRPAELESQRLQLPFDQDIILYCS